MQPRRRREGILSVPVSLNHWHGLARQQVTKNHSAEHMRSNTQLFKRLNGVWRFLYKCGTLGEYAMRQDDASLSQFVMPLPMRNVIARVFQRREFGDDAEDVIDHQLIIRMLIVQRSEMRRHIIARHFASENSAKLVTNSKGLPQQLSEICFRVGHGNDESPDQRQIFIWRQ